MNKINLKKRIIVSATSILLSFISIYIYITYPEQFNYYCQTGFYRCKLFEIASILATFFSITAFSVILFFARKEVYRTWFIATSGYIILLVILFFKPRELSGVTPWAITDKALLILDLLIYTVPAAALVVSTYIFFWFKNKHSK